MSKTKKTTLPETWEEVAKLKGLDPVKSLPYPEPKDKDEEYLNACFVLIKTIALINGDKKFPDYDNYAQLKYEPIWFGSGAGFRYGDYVHIITATAVGSRLVYKTETGLRHGVKHFFTWYKAMLTK